MPVRSPVQQLSRELENGSWDSKYGHLRTQSQFEGRYASSSASLESVGPT
jgi:hypothetical protein